MLIMGVYPTVIMTMTKQFYITVSNGNIESIAIMGTPEFDHYVRSYVLNPSLLSKDELEMFVGSLAVMGLLEYYTPSNDYGILYIKYDTVYDIGS